MADRDSTFDPLGVLAALERQRATYVVIGAAARVIHGADEVTRGVDITPSLRERNLELVEAALVELNARPKDRRAIALVERVGREEAVIELGTDLGEVKIVPRPAGTRGYDDLRRRAGREFLGTGVRARVASIDDLTRMVAALGREQDHALLLDMRRLAELDRSLGRVLER